MRTDCKLLAQAPNGALSRCRLAGRGLKISFLCILQANAAVIPSCMCCIHCPAVISSGWAMSAPANDLLRGHTGDRGSRCPLLPIDAIPMLVDRTVHVDMSAMHTWEAVICTGCDFHVACLLCRATMEALFSWQRSCCSAAYLIEGPHVDSPPIALLMLLQSSSCH